MTLRIPMNGNGKEKEYGRIISIKEEFFSHSRFTTKEQKEIAAVIDLFDEMILNEANDNNNDNDNDNNSIIEAEAKEMIVRECEKRRLSDNAFASLECLCSFYLGYLAPFPDKSEVERASALLEYLTGEDSSWDVMVFLNEENKPVAASSGQVVPVLVGNDTGDSVVKRVLWNEHTWVSDSERGKGCGTKVCKAIENHFKPDLVIIEMDNLFALVDEKKYKEITGSDTFILHPNTEEDKKNNSKYWVEVEKMSMNPIDRMSFWSKQGFKLPIINNNQGEIIPVPYTQISMDPENGQAPCETIVMAIKSIDGSNHEYLTKNDFFNIYAATQATINDNCHKYPSFILTKKHFDSLKDTKVKWVELNGKEALQALQRNVTDKKPFLLKEGESDVPL